MKSSASAAGSGSPIASIRAWSSIAYCYLDRDAEEEAGAFGERIARLEADAVVDLTCYHPASAHQLAGGAARQHIRICFTAARSGFTDPAPPFPPRKTGRANPSATTAFARPPSKPGCWRRPGRPACRSRCFIPAISSGRVGRPSIPPATSTPPSSPRSSRALRSASPTSAWKPFTTSTPKMWRAPFCSPFATARPRWARAFTWSRPPRSPCAAMRSKWRPGSASRRICAFFPGRNGSGRLRARRRGH